MKAMIDANDILKLIEYRPGIGYADPREPCGLRVRPWSRGCGNRCSDAGGVMGRQKNVGGQVRTA
ncbi:MAG: hypothetical protein IPN66_06010 [Candidatus Competibacteraceae bacterium]|nr:hypothetical protein [Candidatus Competibacteraceae bacterium]